MDPKQMSMLSGFNHNIKFRGKVYHVQTEDGGKDNPQVVTLVFLGGVILDSVCFPYDDLVGRPDWHADLRDRMKAQHLEEIRRLMAGEIGIVEEENPDR
jgi:hypothetical protein